MKKGFTMIETVFALMITSFGILLFSLIIQAAMKQTLLLHSGDDERSIHQMRMLFVLSKDYEIYGDMLYFHYQDKDMNFHFDKDKLILEDGYQVFFNDLQAASFTKEDHCYYFHYLRNNEKRKRVIGCE